MTRDSKIEKTVNNDVGPLQITVSDVFNSQMYLHRQTYELKYKMEKHTEAVVHFIYLDVTYSTRLKLSFIFTHTIQKMYTCIVIESKTYRLLIYTKWTVGQGHKITTTAKE